MLHHTVNICHLAGAQVFMRIEAPAPGEQALAAENFVNTRNAPGKLVRGIEQCGVDIRERGTFGKQVPYSPPCGR